MWRSLVWKEWREQHWRLWFGVALLATFTAIGLRTRILPDEEILAFTIMLGGILFPLMVAMGLIAPERSDGTIVRLLALPVRPWQVLAAKALVGSATCAVPVVVSGCLAALIAGDREMSWRQLAQLFVVATGMTLMVFAWFAAAGVRQPSEARAGLAGIGLVTVWALIIATSTTVAMQIHGHATPTEWVAAFSPFGLVLLVESSAPPAAVIAIQFVVFIATWAWAAMRIGRPGKVVA